MYFTIGIFFTTDRSQAVVMVRLLCGLVVAWVGSVCVCVCVGVGYGACFVMFVALLLYFVDPV